MLVHFTKMHGLGNDFVVIDQTSQMVKLHSAHLKRIANRHLGIGCDQIILIDPPIRPEADFYLRLFNADGQEVEQCGNGIRCAARFIFDSGLTNKDALKADCLAGKLTFVQESNGQITVSMGYPIFEPSDIPFAAENTALSYPIQIDNQTHQCHVMSLGNPHATLVVDDISSIKVEKLGKRMSEHAHFPNGANIGFMSIIDRKQIHLRVYERGVGETFACGSGACAAAVAGIRLGLLDSPVKVNFQLGYLTIKWSDKGQPIYMTGPAASVYIGQFRI